MGNGVLAFETSNPIKSRARGLGSSGFRPKRRARGYIPLEARDERRLLKLQAQLAAVKLLIVDELGYVPLSQTGAELLFEIFSQRHEHGSTIVTSNFPFEEWTSVFGNQRMTGALLDRLTHHVHILELNGGATGSSNRRQDGGATLDPPMRSPQPSIPKPAKSPAPPESHGRPGSKPRPSPPGRPWRVVLDATPQTGPFLLRPNGRILLRR